MSESMTGLAGQAVNSGRRGCRHEAMGQGNWRERPLDIGNGVSRMFATIKLSDKDDMGKHETRRQHDMTDGHFTRRQTPHGGMA